MGPVFGLGEPVSVVKAISTASPFTSKLLFLPLDDQSTAPRPRAIPLAVRPRAAPKC